jgi:hypothetical protein
MKKILLFFCMILLLSFSISCKKNLPTTTTNTIETMNDYDIVADNDLSNKENLQTNDTEESDLVDAYAIMSNGDLQIKINNETKILEIDALPDSQIIEDEYQRLLILSNPTDQYQHGILGDDLEASSVTIVQLSEQPTIIIQFSVPMDWVIESIHPIWTDWDSDGEREIILTLSNSTSGSKLVMYDEKGNVLAESLPIGRGSRWRHALEIAPFGEHGQMLLVDVQTPHIGGIVSFYSWDKNEKLIKMETSISGYSTHDIGSRLMHMYSLMLDENNEQTLLILPTQSKTEIAALRLISGEIQEEWRIPLGGKLSGNLELIDTDGVLSIHTIVDENIEVLIKLP